MYKPRQSFLPQPGGDGMGHSQASVPSGGMPQSQSPGGNIDGVVQLMQEIARQHGIDGSRMSPDELADVLQRQIGTDSAMEAAHGYKMMRGQSGGPGMMQGGGAPMPLGPQR